MKKVTPFSAIITSALLLAGCGVSNEPAADTVNTEMTVSAETTSEATAVSSETTEQTTEAVTYYQAGSSELKEYNVKRAYDITDKCISCDLDDDIKELFNQSYYVLLEIFNLRDYEMVGFERNLEKQVAIEMTNSSGDTYTTYKFASGYTYDSFYNYITEVFTVSYADKLLSPEFYLDVNGELCVGDGGRGYNHVKDFVITTESKTEDCVKFHAVVTMTDLYGEWEDYTTENDYEAIKTPDGWRFDHFVEWE